MMSGVRREGVRERECETHKQGAGQDQPALGHERDATCLAYVEAQSVVDGCETMSVSEGHPKPSQAFILIIRGDMCPQPSASSLPRPNDAIVFP